VSKKAGFEKEGGKRVNYKCRKRQDLKKRAGNERKGFATALGHVDLFTLLSPLASAVRSSGHHQARGAKEPRSHTNG
jgi:hypothetical protein